ncbi:MAG: hypothetical protein GKR87_13405 [Kiritimatiellae bacterium]|nr:hypothetical protein [Kiritimatiellia bacterium]
MPSSANDGDSFKVRQEDGSYTYIVRLYFVDTPESDRLIEERVTQQAVYWGRIPEVEVIKLGKQATKFYSSISKR